MPPSTGCVIIDRMIIPQFSLRWLLAVTTVAAVVFSIIGLAMRGSAWAIAVSAGIGSLVVLASVCASMFAVVWVFSVVTSSLGQGRGCAAGSPFGSPFGSESGGSPFQSSAPADNAPRAGAEVPAAPILLDESPAPPEPS